MRPICTVSPPISRSITALKVGILRRYGSSSGVLPAESVLARFSAMMRMRAVCACRPVAAILREERKSFMDQPVSGSLRRLAEGGFEDAQRARVDGGDGLVVHLVGRGLHHLVLEGDAVALGGDLEAVHLAIAEAVGIGAGDGDVGGLRGRRLDLRGREPLHVLLEAESLEVAALVAGGLGIGDV